ncbi:WRKY transcription factor 55 isoform X2 [Prosopis cineraria]|uniref:WRKY transcription factor 55 isoform X2 n=1 Tax=Prosopis cineraria TaxID=364024 RepID=UPI0024102E78|nr:WRKY transcription factor 55 isoform X2 [Prosopis cineraria]
MANSRKQKDLETMEEATSSLIRRACELARNLGSNFAHLAYLQPDVLLASIDETVTTFSAARESLRLFSLHPTSDSTAVWPVRSPGHARPMDQSTHDQMQQSAAAKMQQRMQKTSRKNESETKTVMAPAPRYGNTEIPPDDGFTWRKYGQKEIFGSTHPRSYYRCTHQKSYKCPAKKQVQRLDDNPNTFAVTYRGSHTCILSSTAPSPIPPPHLFLHHFNST